jgi:hypothetical protein
MDAIRKSHDGFAIADGVLRDCLEGALREAGLAEPSDAIAAIPSVVDRESALFAIGAVMDVAARLPTGKADARHDLIRRGVVLGGVCAGYAFDGLEQRAADVARDLRERMAAAGLTACRP